MISYVFIDRQNHPELAIGQKEPAPDFELDDRVKSVELTVEQHFGVRVWDDEKGVTWVELREGAEWSKPVRAREFMRRNLST